MIGNKLRELFRRHGVIPPSPLHAAIQDAAIKEGWTPPWDRQQEIAAKKAAGRQSADVRAGRASIRRHFVHEAFTRLKPAYQSEPFSDQSIAALMRAYRGLLEEDGRKAKSLMKAAPFKASRATLRADLKALGIRSSRRSRRS